MLAYLDAYFCIVSHTGATFIKCKELATEPWKRRTTRYLRKKIYTAYILSFNGQILLDVN